MSIPDSLLKKFSVDHPFHNNPSYFSGFKEAFTYTFRKEKKIKKYAKEKFFVGTEDLKVDQEQFIQHSCELTVGHFFQRRKNLVSIME